MLTKEQVLTFKASADKIYADGDYTSALILYFKAWFALQDFILLRKTGQSPKDHSERFRLLQRKFPETYTLLDREFSTYRETYSKILDKETCERIKFIVENEITKHELN
ncbi:hypothetical protein HYU14_01080 [Candidatus Woesearchaeota archaeon]|nr:hypothetical protein [Candidatus Woesearchaeota archaeon]